MLHLFQRRVNMSYPFALRYVDQFPKDKTIQVSRFVAFITGAIVSVLALASIIDPELFLGFEITKDRTVLFYLGVFTTVWAMARGAVPEDNLVFDPEYALNNVIDYTHYLPTQWQGRLHSDEVRRDFSTLYQMKVVIFLEEILSIIFTPFVLWFSLPRNSDRIIDFFREFTVHVDGLGYVCSFAVFDFKKAGNTAQPKHQGDRPGDPREDYYSTKDGKMLASYYGFLDNYATNPRGVPGGHPSHPTSRRQFHPPPAFPGLMSPTIGTDNSHGSGRHERLNRNERVGSRPGGPGHGINQSMHRTPRFPPMGGHASPMPSMLLDPHHQPSSSGFRTMQPQRNSRSRYPSRRTTLQERIDDEEGIQPDTMQRPGGALGGSGGGVELESNLGESWRTTRATAQDDEDEDEDVDAVTGEKGAGVLGLLYQFQKAQTEGTGVNI